jgi:predicted GNAT family N-acyltransferase
MGAKLLQFMLEQCRKDGFTSFELHAQTRAMGFYRRHGFTACGEEFEEAGIPHMHMSLHDPTPK